jgi:Homeodomain-like domain-containing protein
MDREPAQRVPPVGYRRTHGYSPAIVFEALRLLRLRWKPQAIAETIHVPLGTVYRWESNLVRYGSATNG